MLFASNQQVNAVTTLLFTKSKMGSTWQRERLNLFIPIALICCIQLIQICSAQEAQQPWYENLPAVAMDYKVMYRYFYTRPRSNAMLTIKQQLQLFCVYLINIYHLHTYIYIYIYHTGAHWCRQRGLLSSVRAGWCHLLCFVQCKYTHTRRG